MICKKLFPSVSQKIQRVLTNTREDFDCTIRTTARKNTGLRYGKDGSSRL